MCIANLKFWPPYKRWNLRLNSTFGNWKIISNSRKFAINKFAINVEKMYRQCIFLAGELEKLRNNHKFAISVIIISEFYCTVAKQHIAIAKTHLLILNIFLPKSLGQFFIKKYLYTHFTVCFCVTSFLPLDHMFRCSISSIKCLQNVSDTIGNQNTSGQGWSNNQNLNTKSKSKFYIFFFWGGGGSNVLHWKLF